jgi:hypothetical protein
VERLALPPVGRRVLTRLSLLDRSARLLGIASAVLGDGAQIAQAARLADIAEPDLCRSLEALYCDDVLAPSDRVRFTQPILARSILAATPPNELAQWRRRTADVLEAADAPVEEIVAQLQRAAPAGDLAVVGRLRLAAHRARQVGDCATAAAHLRRALEEGVPEFERDLALELAQVHASRTPAGCDASRSPADAILMLERARRLTGPPADDRKLEAELRHLEHELSAAVGD